MKTYDKKYLAKLRKADDQFLLETLKKELGKVYMGNGLIEVPSRVQQLQDMILERMRKRGKLKEIKVEINPIKVAEADPSIIVYNIELYSDESIWSETCGSMESLSTFLRGVQAGWNLSGVGFFAIPPIPKP